MKIDIGDVGDLSMIPRVFLEQGSFSSQKRIRPKQNSKTLPILCDKNFDGFSGEDGGFTIHQRFAGTEEESEYERFRLRM